MPLWSGIPVRPTSCRAPLATRTMRSATARLLCKSDPLTDGKKRRSVLPPVPVEHSLRHHLARLDVRHRPIADPWVEQRVRALEIGLVEGVAAIHHDVPPW